MLAFLADLFGPALSWLLGFFVKRRVSDEAQRYADNQAKAEAQSGALRDQVDAKLERASADNAKALDAARAAGDRPDGLRDLSDAVNASVDQANRELR